jgi:hypothetical protein
MSALCYMRRFSDRSNNDVPVCLTSCHPGGTMMPSPPAFYAFFQDSSAGVTPEWCIARPEKLNRRPLIYMAAGSCKSAWHFFSSPLMASLMLLSTALLGLVACVLATDQSPPTAFALTQQYRPDTKWRTCKSTGGVRANCGFCYGSGETFMGWNCNCDKFVSIASWAGLIS